MIRALGALLVALFACACAPGYVRQPSDAYAILQQDGQPVCSAFAVGPHEAVTAAHCVDSKANLSLVSRELYERTARGAAAAEIERIDDVHDLAWLRTPLTFGAFLRPRPLREGEPVSVVSAFAGWKQSPGRILPGYGFFRDTDVTIQHGWSGSPVLGLDGKVVGVVVTCWGPLVNNRHVCQSNDMQFSVLP